MEDQQESVIYRAMPLPMTLTDPEAVKPLHSLHIECLGKCSVHSICLA